MRIPILVALMLTATAPCFSQTPAAPNLPSDPRAVFAAAAPFYDFTDVTLKPWHLKATYQLYDDKGNPSEQGTYEYWWASPKLHRSSWIRGNQNRTDWWTAGGALYRKESGGPLRYFERTLETALLSPLPQRSEIESGRLKLELMKIPGGQESFACVTTSLQWKVDGKLMAPTSATPQYYCFDLHTMTLRMAYSSLITTMFSQIVKTQGHFLARQVAVSDGMQRLFSISVDAIDGLDPLDAALKPAADSIPTRATVSQPVPGETGDGVTAGPLVKKTFPTYPMMAKMARQQGVVVLAAVIGTDGRVRDLEVLSSPSPLLADSAVKAVKQWEYKPYLLNGAAVEVETVVNVYYSLGR